MATGVLYPFLGILLRHEISAVAMTLSDITVAENSLLLRRYVPEMRLKEPEN